MMNQVVEVNKEQSLKKHVAAIHASNPLTLIQRKLANVLLYNAYQNLLTQEEHIISIRELCVLIDFESHAIEQVKTAVKKLMSTVIEWNLVDREKETKDNYWVASTMLASVEIKAGICKYTYSKHLKELFYHPELFATLDMLILRRFKSSYGLALYENCIRFKKVRQTPWFEIPVFRKLMGVAEKKYTQFSDFKRRVIDAAVKEVNEHAQINLNVELKQEGRVVKAIKFYIAEGAHPLTSEADVNVVLTTEEEKVWTLLIHDLAVDSQDAKNWLAEYGAEYVFDKVMYIMSTKAFKSGAMNYPTQYLKKALEKDYKAPKSSSQLLWEAKQKKETEIENKRVHDKKLEKQKLAYSSYKTETVIQKFSQLTAKEKKELLRAFSSSKIVNDAPVLQDLFNRSSLDSPIVRSHFIKFWLQINPTLYDDVITLEDYIMQQKNAHEKNI